MPRRSSEIGLDHEARQADFGIGNLRAFRPGVDALGNGETAERTGLPRSSVSRLTKTLVPSGGLDEDLARARLSRGLSRTKAPCPTLD
ncbi:MULTISPECIES: helix-turn-helix domain-containing protein [Bradyrhizobium]|uniref:HTH iclR-type domain-containing protein n=1 Tax=Bradyrhizobium elkanii TaxID=29448 RepID=A0A4U6S6L7_BRAEL|nr:hypothetical protein [Bradyrhizobium sp. BR2003]TKV83547.1 hypothetical protein FDV58_03575 [Bradyrhizobium elkanii]